MSKLNRSKIVTTILLILVAGFSVTSLSYATQTPLFSILPPVAALPTINLAPSSGAVGTVVTITGTGFLGADTSCVVTGTGTIIGIPPATCTIAASTIGAGVTFTVGDAAPGPYTITVTGSPGADVATSTFTVLPPAIVLNPTSAPAGTTVTVNGSHFSLTDAACTITGGVVTGATCTIIAGSGIPTGSFVAGAIAPGIYTVTLKGTTTGDTAQASFTIPTPAISLTPTSGPVNTAVTISGGGFNLADAGVCVISQAPAAPVIVAASTCTIDTSGNMAPSGFSVAPSATPGTYTITVTGTSGDSASKTFTVTTSAPFIVPTPNAAASGAHITVTGGGFNSGDAGTCTFGQSPSVPVISDAATCTITASGQLTGSGFTVAGLATPGTYLLTVTGTTGDIGQAGFTVTGPHIALSPISGPVTTPVSVTGGGFATGDAGLCSYLQSPASPVLFTSVSCTITAAGQLTGSSFTVANTATPGAYLVQAKGSTGDISGTATFTVTGASGTPPKITLSPNQGQTGIAVTVTGTGFSLGDTFCNIGPSTLAITPTCTITAGSGAPSGSFFVGGVVPGVYTVTVTGSTGDTATATFTVTAPKIVLTPNSGVTGITVTVTGTFFETVDTTCTITGGPIVVAPTCTIITPGAGNPSGSFSVGGVLAGTYTITVTGSSGDAASASFTVVSNPSITLTPNNGPVGSEVTVTGAGFSAADTTCTITGGLLIAVPTCTFVTPGDGSPSGTFFVGVVSPGTYTVTVTGSTGDAAHATFTVPAPFIIVSPNAAPVGTKISVAGSGFNTGDAGTCTFSQAPAVPVIVASATCTINAAGQVAGSGFTVNAGATPGTYTLTVTGTTGDSASASFTITTNTPFIVLTPATAPIGTNIVVTGSGFNTGDAGVCTFGQSPSSPIIVGAPATCTINSSGQLIGSGFPVATSAIPGTYTVTVTGTTGDIASATFVVQGPQVTLTPTSGSIGTNVAATGFGFNTADAGLCSFLQSPAAPVLFASVSCTITPTGTLTGSGFTVAPTATPGTYLVQVKGSTGDISDPGFTVTVNAPTVNVNPASGTTGAAISVTGSGFVAADAGLCSFLQSPASPILFASVSCAINAAGQLVGSSFTVAATATTGSYIVTVKGSTGDTGSTTFFVTKGPQIILSPVSGHQGTGVTITGTGFSSNDAGACTITSGLVGLIGPNTCAITSAGTLQSTSFSVGSVAPATATVTVTGGTGDSASATFIVVTNTPSLTLTPNSGPVLAGITMTGSGFNTGDAAACTASSTPTNIVILTACTLSNGQLTGSSFQVASVATPGLYVVTVKGSSGDFATQAFVVTVTGPTITLTPSTGPSGTAVAVTGHGFNTADVGLCSFLQSPSAPVLFTAVACSIDATGTLSATSFTVASPINPGTYVVSVKGSTGDTASANFVVTGPSIKVNPVSGPIGTNIGVTGSGFNTGDVGACSFLQSPATPVIFASVSCSIALSGGIAQLSASSFMVATTATPGPYTVSVKGSTGDIASTTFVVTTTVPSLVLSPNSGPINTHVLATGASFNPADAGVCVFGQVPTAPVIITSTSCTINSSGQLSASGFTIATTALPGVYAVTVKGSTGDVATAAFTVTVNGPTITLTPNTGPISTQVAVTGVNFNTADSGPCTYSQAPAVPGIVVASACNINVSGQLVTSGFTIATSAVPGVYTITVTGGTGDTASATFTVTSNSLAAITLSPTGGPSGTGVTIAGTGFSPGTGVAGNCLPLIQSPTVPTLFATPQCTINSSGALSGSSFVVAGTATPGTYVVSVKDSAGNIASAGFVVTGPHISLSPASGPTGTGVTVTGGGFSITDAGACSFLQSPSTPVLYASPTCTITSSGLLTATSFVVATTATNGQYVVTVKGSSGDIATAAFTVNPFSPSITVTPDAASDGATVTITGSGFNPTDASCPSPTSTPLTVWVTPPTCAIVNGKFTATFTVPGPTPSAPPGTYTITITGNTGDAAEATFVVSGEPTNTISFNPATGGKGSTVGVAGTVAGFFTSCTIQSTSGNVVTQQACTVTNNSNTGTTTTTATATATITTTGSNAIGPAIVVNPTSGTVSAAISVSGGGFNFPDAGSCTLLQSPGFPGLFAAPSCTITASGQLTGTGFIVANTAAQGTYIITVRGSTGDTASAVFTVTGINNLPPTTAFIDLNPSTGAPGTAVSVSGGLFNFPDAGACTLSQSPASPVLISTPSCTITVSGQLIGSGFTVATTATPGSYIITVKGITGDTANAIFTVPGTSTPSIVISPSTGSVGSAISVTGSAFPVGDAGACSFLQSPSSPVLFTAVSCTISASGQVVGSGFTVAATATPQTYVVTVKGSTGDTASAIFSVTGTIVTSTVTATATATVTSSTPVTTFQGHFVVSSNAQTGPATITVILSGTGATVNVPGVFVVQGPFIQLSDPFAIGQVLSGPVGTHVSITGSFFPLSDTTCSISQGTGTGGGGTFIVNGGCSVFQGAGAFAGYNNVTGSFVVGNVQEGQYVVQVQSSGSGTFAQAVFNVTAGAFIQLSGPGPSGFARVGQAASGPQGSSVKVSGSQFQPGDLNGGTCSISAISGGNAIAGGSSACSFFKAPNGFVNVTGSFIVGNANPGQYAIQISGPQGDSAQAILNVTRGAFIQLFPTSGTVGSFVNFEGSNFQPGSTTCTVGVAGQSSGNFVAGGTAACATFNGANGFKNVTGSFTVGNVQPGEYVIQVSGSQGEFAQAVFTVTSGPFIQLSGASGGFVGVGQTAKGGTGLHVHVEGSAFLTTDTSCTIGVGGQSSGNFIAGGTAACSVFTDQSGTFKGATNVTASFTIGNVQPGEYVVQISGNQGDFAQAIFEVTGGPFIQVSTGPPSGFASVGQPAKGQVGSHVSVEGSNFLTTDTSCTVGVGGGSSGNFISGGTAACAVFTVGGVTNVTASFRVGNVQPGQYLVQISGNQGDFAQALVNVTSGPFIQLSAGPPNGFARVGQPASGPTGSHVNIEGSDFVSTDTTCTIGVGGGTSGNFIAAGSGCTLFTAGNGFQNVTASFTVGNVAPGQYVVQISGNQGDFAQALFNVTSGPVLTISPGSGRLGTDVIINGTNFLRTDTSCSLSSPTGAIITGGACTIVNGVAAGSFIVGNVLPGQYVIQVSGNQGDFGQIIFRVVGGSLITLNPGTGRPGAHVLVNGTGFLPTDSSCTLSSPGSGAVLAGSAACAVVLGSGLTNSSFIIGNVLPGQYLIQISGNQGDFAQAVLNVVGGPSISLSPGTASIGELVLVNGTGFLPTDISCVLVSGASNTNNPITPSSGGCAITAGTGVANASLIVSGVPPGQYVIQITGSSGDSAQAVLNILLAPSVLSLYPTNATNGATVNFRATGLSTSDTSCTIEAGTDNNHVFTQNSVVLSSPTCAIGPTTVGTGTFIVGPYATEEKNWTIRIRGSPAQDLSELAVFNVTASVIVTPNSGSINSVFTYTGSGFESTATSCKAVVIPPFPNAPTLGCYFSPGIGQVSGSIIVPRGAFPGTYGIQILDNTGSSATGVFTVGTPTAQLVLNPASQGQSQQVGFAATGLNPNDTYCAVTAGANPPWIGPDGTAPSCSISGGYASGAFRISDTATGGYYLITVTGYAQPPASPCPAVGGISANTCAGLGGGDFAQNFLGVTLDTTVTTFSSTTSTSTSTTSQTFTTTSMATSYSYSSSTQQTTGILYTTYWHGTSTTVFASTTSTFGLTTTTTQSWTSVTVTTTTVQTTGCGPLPCPFAIGSLKLNVGQPLSLWQPNLALFSDNFGILAVLLLIVPILLRRLFT